MKGGPTFPDIIRASSQIAKADVPGRPPDKIIMNCVYRVIQPKLNMSKYNGVTIWKYGLNQVQAKIWGLRCLKKNDAQIAISEWMTEWVSMDQEGLRLQS